MNFLEKQIENPVRMARIKRCFYVGLAVIALAEIFLPVLFPWLNQAFAAINLPAVAKIFDIEHAHGFWFESIPAWGSLYGLISCLVIIVVSKFLGKVWLMRREDYYDS